MDGFGVADLSGLVRQLDRAGNDLRGVAVRLDAAGVGCCGVLEAATADAVAACAIPRRRNSSRIVRAAKQTAKPIGTVRKLWARW